MAYAKRQPVKKVVQEPYSGKPDEPLQEDWTPYSVIPGGRAVKKGAELVKGAAKMAAHTIAKNRAFREGAKLAERSMAEGVAERHLQSEIAGQFAEESLEEGRKHMRKAAEAKFKTFGGKRPGEMVRVSRKATGGVRVTTDEELGPIPSKGPRLSARGVVRLAKHRIGKTIANIRAGGKKPPPKPKSGQMDLFQ